MSYKQNEIRELTAQIERTANDMWQAVYFELDEKELDTFELTELRKILRKLQKLSKQLPEFLGIPF